MLYNFCKDYSGPGKISAELQHAIERAHYHALKDEWNSRIFLSFSANTYQWGKWAATPTTSMKWKKTWSKRHRQRTERNISKAAKETRIDKGLPVQEIGEIWIKNGLLAKGIRFGHYPFFYCLPIITNDSGVICHIPFHHHYFCCN